MAAGHHRTGSDIEPAGFRQAPIEPLAVDADQASALLGLSRSMFYKMAEAGKIGPIGRRFGKCVRYSLAELRDWAAAGMPPRHVWQDMIAERAGSQN